MMCSLSVAAQLLIASTVVEQLNEPWDESIQLPTLICGEAVDRTLYEETWGFAPDVVVNHYHWPSNSILLVADARLDQLAHELAHWVQFNHQRVEPSGQDYLETQAVHVQNWWRS